jgi:membrane protein DedA with SNARE-associated domain
MLGALGARRNPRTKMFETCIQFIQYFFEHPTECIETFFATHPYLCYLVLFLGTFFEGETIVILAGLAAHEEYMSLPWVMTVSFCGSYAGDQMWYYVGRHKGNALIAKRPWWRRQANRVFRLLDKHATWVTLAFRFWYGLRNITPVAIGMSGMRPLRFAILNGIGAAIWSVTLSYGAYKIGDLIWTWIERAKGVQFKILGGILLAAVIIAVLRWIKHRRYAKRAAAEEAAMLPPVGSAGQDAPEKKE